MSPNNQHLHETNYDKACYYIADFSYLLCIMSPNHPLFPLKMNVDWQQASYFNVNERLLDWLLDPSSLTARLKKHCVKFRVELLGQHLELCSAREANTDIAEGVEVLVREVVLWCDEKPQVFARSLLPTASLTGSQQALSTLGIQSLGQVLFNTPNMKRKGIELGLFVQHSKSSNVIKALALTPLKAHGQPLFARRSIFVINNKPIMVAEAFLPGAFAYQEN